jgi:hydrogenase expression/formation protein HypE
LDTGKLTNQELKDIVFSRLPKLSDRTVLGASIGADCAYVSLGDKMLVASTDPITAGGMQSGTLAVHVSCNDIVTSGVRPIGLLVVILAPSGSSREEITQIVEQASSAAQELGVDIIGGHTEITDSVRSLVITTTAFGVIDENTPRILGKACPGDTLLMTKTAAIEGTWIIAMNHEDRLLGQVNSEDIVRAKGFISKISVVPDGTLATACIDEGNLETDNQRRESLVHLMHDSTEGGILGAAYEMAEFSGIGLTVDIASIPVDVATMSICKALSIDPLRLISSGSILIATPCPNQIIAALSENGVQCTEIGQFTETGMHLRDSTGNYFAFDPPSRDLIYDL